MAEKQKQTVMINDVEYTEDQLNDEQKILINHVADLDRKISSTEFNLNQLKVGREAHMDLLTKALGQDKKVAAE
ncbi:hypothetical protein CRP901_gp47 [Roseobacter phage CRP-901]|nr:hypothetical protein CRP901_gp47 [Roseobacter phage CRP-901]